MIKNLFIGIYKLTQFKTLEIQLYLCELYFNGLDLSISLFSDKKYLQFYLDLYILKINLDFTRRCDHHGISLNLSFFNLNFDINQYDIRHWDEIEERMAIT